MLVSDDWETFLAGHPGCHLLQTTAWGELKAGFGWQVRYVVAEECGALVLFRQPLPGFTMAYIPKGPVGHWHPAFWKEVDSLCRKNGCVFIKVEPDTWEWREQDSAQGVNPPPGFFVSAHPIQPPRTSVVDLQGDETHILGRMKQKTRYNINLAQKKGVVAHPTDDVRLFHNMMQVTGQRDEFGVHSLAYYQQAFELFTRRDACQLLVAEYENRPLAAIMVFMHGLRAWYFYGASSNEHRELMPNYTLQWEAMRWARLKGCTEYDLWGVPDCQPETLEAEFTKRSDGLWGVYRFKRGFGGELRRAAGPWDRVYNPLLYRIYQLWLRFRKIE